MVLPLASLLLCLRVFYHTSSKNSTQLEISAVLKFWILDSVYLFSLLKPSNYALSSDAIIAAHCIHAIFAHDDRNITSRFDDNRSFPTIGEETIQALVITNYFGWC